MRASLFQRKITAMFRQKVQILIGKNLHDNSILIGKKKYKTIEVSCTKGTNQIIPFCIGNHGEIISQQRIGLTSNEHYSFQSSMKASNL
jgi:hypothetical protein